MNNIIKQSAGIREDFLRKDLKDCEDVILEIKNQLKKNNPPHEKRYLEQKLKEKLAIHNQVEDKLEDLIQRNNNKGYESMPKDCFINDKSKYIRLGIQQDGRVYWKDNKNHVYSWDGKSREIEIFGPPKWRDHLGTMNIKGIVTNKDPVKNRNASFIK